MKYHPMLCFGRVENSGNMAIVVEDFASDNQARQAFARQQGAPATVYLDVEADGTIALDYYYPHTRSPLCLHATLAAAVLLFERLPSLAEAHVVSAMHRQRLAIQRDGALMLIGLRTHSTPAWTVDLLAVAELLRVAPHELLDIPALASVGSPKLLVRVRNESMLHGLRPDLDGIAAWGKMHQISGIYAYALGEDGVYSGRNFNHLSVNLEDAATGVAAGALALFLKQDIRLRQGDRLGQPCTLTARYTDKMIYVGGRAQRAPAALR